MNKVWFRGVGERGLIAIYEAPEQSDDIEDNPLNHLDKTFFNSLLAYVGGTKVTQTYTIPARSSGFFAMERVNLAAHGKGYAPACLPILKGWLNGDGNPVDIPLMGGVPLDFYGQRPGDSGVFDYEGTTQDRWSRAGPTFRRTTYFDDTWEQKSLLVGAGADDTNLFLWYEQAVVPEGGDGASYPALTLTIDFYIADQSIDGTVADPPPSNVFRSDQTGVFMSAKRLTATGTGDGGFDSNKRYVYANAVDPLFWVVTGDALEFSQGGTFPNTYTRNAFYFAPQWSFDLKEKAGSPTIPALVQPTVQGLSL